MGANILIVDDQEENRYLLEALLKGSGFEVRSVSNGVEALDQLRAGHPDLIISDILMPVMDGFEFCRRVKSDGELRRIPLIIYTATYTGPQDEAFALQIGADRFIQKPCEPDAFLQAVREVLAGAGSIGRVSAPAPPREEDILKLYNERLVRKIEQKVLQLEQEVHAREQAQKVLRQRDEELRAVIRATPMPIIRVDREDKVTLWNPAAERVFGWSEEEVMGRPIPYLAPEMQEESRRVRHRALAGETVDGVETVRQRKDGRLVQVRMWLAPVYDESGNISGSTGLLQDVSQERQMEEQLRQSQKMEAVGQLAGGVAHDFNNLLTPILGYCDLILENEALTEPSLRDDVQQIKEAAERASQLTRQILAFSRRQPLQPRTLNINDVVSEMEPLLRRTLGEDVHLLTAYAPHLGATEVDAHELQQALLNLVVNARAAMPSGGKLTLETSNVELDDIYCRTHPEVEPGQWVMLAVSDSGTGMAPEVLARVFEPFYTTKAPGEGTGLGLSMVYGIVRQSGGHVGVYSEPGQGTTFRIYLPRSQGSAERLAPALAEEAASGGSETILVVEDDPGVRDLTERILAARGYTVLTAPDATEGAALLAHCDTTIDLLLTDVVLPGGMQGGALGRAAGYLRPELPIIYMSGYARSAIVHSGRVDEGVDYLAKPFTPESLARKVRRALDGRHAEL
jgi:two-component system cell cycle sensor histidine kinase/response regulator CckA